MVRSIGNCHLEEGLEAHLHDWFPNSFCDAEHGMACLLIIDDEESVCQMLGNAFRKKGHLVESVSNVRAAKKEIESLVLSDVNQRNIA